MKSSLLDHTKRERSFDSEINFLAKDDWWWGVDHTRDPFDYRAFGSFTQGGPPRDNVSKRIIKEDTHLEGTK